MKKQSCFSFSRRRVLLLLGTAALALPPAFAEEGFRMRRRMRMHERHGKDKDHDHARARDALEHGEIRPLAEVLQSVSQQLPGEVISVELEREDGRWVYEFKIIDANSVRKKVKVDAQTKVILDLEEKRYENFNR